MSYAISLSYDTGYENNGVLNDEESVFSIGEYQCNLDYEYDRIEGMDCYENLYATDAALRSGIITKNPYNPTGQTDRYEKRTGLNVPQRPIQPADEETPIPPPPEQQAVQNNDPDPPVQDILTPSSQHARSRTLPKPVNIIPRNGSTRDYIWKNTPMPRYL